ncbi:hypothetical protein GQ473_01275 [archaeon]|nr:hypothetical protein [archaeon]
MATKTTLMPTAYTLTIKDLIDGEYKTPANEPAFLETAWGLSVFKCNLIATVIDNYVSDDEKYASITLDDGTGVIRSKAFQNTRVIADIKAGTIIQFIGWIRNYNDELYLVPEIVKPVTNYDKLSLMKIEAYTFKKKFLKEKIDEKTDHKEINEQPNEQIIKETITTPKPTEPTNTKSADSKPAYENTNAEEPKKEPTEKEIRQKVVTAIESLDKGEGVDYADILKNVNLELQLVEKAIDELLSEGSCYEPRAGKLKVL